MMPRIAVNSIFVQQFVPDGNQKLYQDWMPIEVTRKRSSMCKFTCHHIIGVQRTPNTTYEFLTLSTF